MSKNLRILWIHFKSYLQVNFEYRLAAVLWVINGFVGPFIALFAWDTVSKGGDFPLTSSELITYFLSTVVVFRLTQSWSLDSIGRRIKGGVFSQYLLRPAPYFLNDLAKNLSAKFFRLSTLCPFMAIFFLIFRSQFQWGLIGDKLTVFFLASVLGFLINYFFQNAVSMLAFWTTEIHGVDRTFEIIGGFFSGSVIPVVIMPGLLKKMMIFLPFRYFVSFPIEVFLSSLQTDVLSGFLIGVFWMFFWLFLWRFLFIKGVRKYSAIGG
jgi:ABC-2 type transport system permease protein